MFRLKLDITTRSTVSPKQEDIKEAQASGIRASVRRRVTLTLDGAGASHSAATEFDFSLSVQDQEDFRWYFEDYGSENHCLVHSIEQSSTGKTSAEIALQIEKKLASIGKTLFKKVFNANEKTAALWAVIKDHLDDVRVELLTDETVIPWELLTAETPSAESETQSPLALSVASFVRSVAVQTENAAPTGASEGGAVRILMVIPRIGGGDHISFQSAAMRMVTGLCKPCRSYMQMDVLHPPSFAAFEKALRLAKEDGKPYHVIHFDGHSAIYGPQEGESNLSDSENQGFLVFESSEKPDLISGTRLASLMAETDVPILLLNTCHSAYPGLLLAPLQDREEGLAQKTAFERVARACCSSGAGVVLLPYQMQVNTAAKFVANIYAALAQGVSLGEGVRLGRKDLYSKPQRDVAGDPFNLSDWCAPQIYEAQPLTVAPKAELEGMPIFRVALLERGTETIPESIDRRLSNHLPRTGLVGRDELILNLDRAFDYQGVVLLYGADGAGKTAAAAGLALWQTRAGTANPVIVTFMERCRNFTEMLESFGQVYEQALVERRISWYSLTDLQRQELIKDLAKKVPFLWVLDNLETISAPGKSKWNEADQESLFQFLTSLKELQARVLLVSKNNEEELLKDLPIRLHIPALEQTDGVQVLWSRLKNSPLQPDGSTNWLPLLEISQGSPAALNLLACRAAVAGQPLDSFIQSIEATMSNAGADSVNALIRLAVNQFEPDEQKVLALLVLFQNFVDVDALCAMANPKNSWHLQEITELNREKGLVLLDRAVDLGLLARIQPGYYLMPAALPGQLGWLFQQYYSDIRPLFAFAEMAKGLCSDYLFYYNQGNKGLLGVLAAEESNLLHALIDACSKHQQHAKDTDLQAGWLDNLQPLLKVLHLLYTEGRRFAAWARLLNEVQPYFSNPKTQQPLRKYQQEWLTLNDFRVENARFRGNLTEASEYQALEVEWEKTRAAPSLRKDPGNFTKKDRQTITILDEALLKLARIFRSMGSGRSREPFAEAYQGLEMLGEKVFAAGVALEIADVYIHIPVQRDLAAAEEWVERSRGLRDEADLAGRARCQAVVGQIVFERFLEAQKAAKPMEEQVALMNEALGCYFDALDDTPEDAADELGVIHESLGFLYLQSEGMVDSAMEHYNEAVRYKEKCEDRHGAAKTRFNAAVALFLLNHFKDSKEYALEALKEFELLGVSAALDVIKVRSFVSRFPADGTIPS